MGRGGSKPYSKSKLNDKHILTVLVKGVGTSSSSKKGGASSKTMMEFLELVFIVLIT